MKCVMVKEQLTAYLQNELPVQTAASIAGHLDGCPDCACEKALIEAHLQLYRSLPVFEPGSHVWENIYHEIQGDSPVRIAEPRQQLQRYKFLLAAAVLLIAVGGLFLLRRSAVAQATGLWLRGGALVKIGDTGSWQAADQQAIVLPANKSVYIRSRANSKALLGLGPAVKLYLFCNTHLSFHSPSQIKLQQGEIVGQVKPGTHFVLSTKYAKLTVLGTSFSVQADANQACAYVYKGEARWHNRYGQVFVKGGSISTATGKRAPTPPSYQPTVQLPSWVYSPLAILLQVPPQPYPGGQPVPVSFSLINLGCQHISICPFSHQAPHFLFRIAHNGKIFDTPVIPTTPPPAPPSNGRLRLAPAASYTLHCTLKNELRQPGEYHLIGIYQAPSFENEPQQGVLFSTPVRIMIGGKLRKESTQ